MKRSILFAVALATATAFAAPLVVRAADPAKTTATKGQKASAEPKDPNIRTPQKANDPKATGSKKQMKRQSVCIVNVDNWTPWYIQVYVDGDFSGIVAPWDEGYTFAVSGPTRAYARAEFPPPTPATTWGPVVFNCPPGDVFTWRLDP
jgi:hypothetical protein